MDQQYKSLNYGNQVHRGTVLENIDLGAAEQITL